MKKLLSLLIAALAISMPALAVGQTVPRATASAPVYDEGANRPLSLDLSGNLRVVPSTGTGASSQQVQGAAASGAAAAGNPVAVGCDFNTTRPTVTTGQRVAAQCTPRGALYVTLTDASLGQVGVLSGSADDNSLNTQGLTVFAFNGGFDGAAWDRSRFVTGALTNGTGTQAVALSPSSASGAALASSVTSADAGSLTALAAPGNLYEWQVTTAGTAGYVLIFNATAAPADGSVTPVQCVAVAANSTVGASMHTLPERMTVGAVIVFSSTGCFTKTASATAFIRARAL